MLKEFQEFISKGNVMDLAVGVIIGGAFGLIVSSLVGDIIMPIVGAIFGGFDFSNYFLPLVLDRHGHLAGGGQASRARSSPMAISSRCSSISSFSPGSSS